MKTSSPSLHYGQKGPEGVEETLKVKDLPGLETSHTLQLAVGARCPQSPRTHQSSDSCFKRPLHGAADGPGTKSTFTVSVALSSQQRKVFCLFPRSKLVCRKISVRQTITNHISRSSFPRILLHLLVTRSLKISKCFMKKGNLLFQCYLSSGNWLLFIASI